MTSLQIIGSVGIGGTNNPNDVKEVQKALNKLLSLIPPTQRLAEDSKIGVRPENSKTVAAIRLFQKAVVGSSRPDGRIDVNGKTHRTVNTKLTAAAISASAVGTTIPWMKTALAEVGQNEVAGKKANPRILEYFKSSKFWGTDDSGGANAWCASFVSWVMEQNGFSPVSNAFRAKEWASFGKKISHPVYGAIGIKSRQGGGHVAFVVGQSADGKHLYMLGGNQGNMVQIKRYQASVWNTFVVPIAFNTDAASLPVYTKAAADAGSEA
ncbi:MAG: TIGR02594 family protein [Motiliproteus sp.]